MDPRKRLLKRAAAEVVNDRFIVPQKYRDKMMNVTTYSSLLLLAEVRGWLSVNEQAIFKGTAIGHLLSVPEDSKFSGTIVHFLLSREIHVDDKPDEMHFKVGGKILHFGKREFALITGLSFRKSRKAFVSPTDPSSLMRTYFPNQDRIIGSKVRTLLSKKNSTFPSLDRVKLSLLLVVHRFLMGRQDSDIINIVFWHLVDDLEEFNKYPWGEVTFDRAIARLKSPLLYQANKKNSDAGGDPTYKVLGLAQALVVWALDIMPGLLDLCGRKIESRGWKPHMLCVLCTRSPYYPPLIRTLEVDDVHVLPDVMWHKGDRNQLIVLGLEEGTPEVVDLDSEDSVQEMEDSNQGHEVPETASVFLSKKRKASTEESRPGEVYSSEPITIPSQESVSQENENNIHHTNVKDSHGKDVDKRNMPSCSGAITTEIESLEVGELVGVPVDATSSSKGLTCDSSLLNSSASVVTIPIPTRFTMASAQERVEEFEFVDNLKIPEEYLILNTKICEMYGHMATRKLIKFNDAMLLACVTSLLKIISAMENVRGSELSEALLERWEGSIKDAEALEFNVKWLREGFNRIKNHWRSSFGIDREVESHAQVLDAMQVKYDCLSTRERELETELSEVKLQKTTAEATISSERKSIQDKLTEKIKFQNEPVLGLLLS